MTEDVVFDLLRQVPLFADAPEAGLREVARVARPLARRKGARIFEEGSPADSCYVLTAGRAKVVLTSTRGADVILGLVEPCQLVGEIALLDNSTRSAGLVALDDCQLIRVSADAFHSLRSSRAFQDSLIVHLSAMLRRATEQVRAIQTYSSPERVCWCLARLAARSGRREGGKIVIRPRTPHHEIADMTGCSRETVSRVLVQLRDSRWVTWTDAFLAIDEKSFARYLEVERGIGTAPPVARIV
jgi:CRP-like cAMP-binding protein